MLDYGAKGEAEADVACAFIADAVAELAARLYGREAEWGVEPGALDRRQGLRRRLPGAGLPGRAGDPGRAAPPSRRGLRDGAGRLPPLRRREADVCRRAHPPPQRRHPRRPHRRAGRDGCLWAVGAGGVRRLRHRRRTRLHRDGRRHRGAVPRLAGRGRVPHHPARDPEPGPPQGWDRGPEAGVAAPAGVAARRWPRSPSPSPTSAPTWPGSRRPRSEPTAGGWSTASRPGARSPPGPTCSCSWPGPIPTGRRPTAASACSSCRSRGPTATGSSSPRTTAAGSRAGRSTPSATAACIPTSSPSRTGSSTRPASWAGRTGWDRASIFRWPGSRTAVSRRRRAPSA